jgi:type IV pilus assembly protein PilB
MRQFPLKQLKDLLVKDGVVSPEVFDATAKDAARLKQSVVGLLVARGILSWDYYYAMLAKYYGVERVNLAAYPLDESAMRLLPEEIARDKGVFVMARAEKGGFYVAMEDPSDLQTIEFLKKYLKGDIFPFLASDEDLNKSFKLYSQKSAEDFRIIINENIRASLELGKSDIDAAGELPIVSIVNTLLSYAVASRASDVHIEITESDFLVRFRIDGILHEITRLPREVHPAIIARVKILSNLKLDEHVKPQDGRFRLPIGGSIIDARVSIMPTLYGEKVAMRILPAQARPLSLEELGFLEDDARILKDNLKKSYGMVLVTGPTGSGKTTTLYAMISILNKPEVNIVTIEDPIEFGIPNVNQTQINEEAGISFAAGLRAIVRQDPNVVMVGEIRDRETAEISIHSALTGSLVLSTLHTNNAATAVPRLLDMGAEAFLVAAVLNLIIAQRLVRRICLECIASYKPDAAAIDSIKLQFKNLGLEGEARAPKILYKGAGCLACNNIGYKGRIGIYETLQVTDAIRSLIVSPELNLASLEKLARREGMISMFEDGLRKAERGITTIEEVLRVIRE